MTFSHKIDQDNDPKSQQIIQKRLDIVPVSSPFF